MNKRITILAFLAVLVLVAGCAPPEEIGADIEDEVMEDKELSTDQAVIDTDTEEMIVEEEGDVEDADDAMEDVAEENVVEITSDGFSPDAITVGVGETVTWINRDTDTHWPASATHPSHTVYPTTGGCIGSTFDACGALGEGESWSFTFDEVGEWKYHDHLNPSLWGSVTVQ